MSQHFWTSAVLGGWLLAVTVFAVNAGIASHWCAILALVAGMNIDDAINRFFTERRARSALGRDR